MVSSDLRTDIDSKLEETFKMIAEKVFSGPSVMTVPDLLQLKLNALTRIISYLDKK